ncbi:helix-turn-helix domain-containing protein [archaeon]|jgi:excisionase family DNA binding protein|nr:helix-turn-helix domain-containing protein [archaeon]
MKTNNLSHLVDEIKSMEEYAKSKNEIEYTSGQVAEFMGVSVRTIAKLFDDKHLKGYRRPGSGHRRIPTKHLLDFINKNGFEHAFKSYQNHLIRKGYIPQNSPKN